MRVKHAPLPAKEKSPARGGGARKRYVRCARPQFLDQSGSIGCCEQVTGAKSIRATDRTRRARSEGLVLGRRSESRATPRSLALWGHTGTPGLASFRYTQNNDPSLAAGFISRCGNHATTTLGISLHSGRCMPMRIRKTRLVANFLYLRGQIGNQRHAIARVFAA